MNLTPDYSVIEWVLARLVHYDFAPILCTSIHESDDSLAMLGEAAGIHVFRGSLENKVDRWQSCMEHFGLTYTYLADADDPFFSGEVAHLSMRQLADSGSLVVLPAEKSDAGEAYVGTSVTLQALQVLSEYFSENDISEIDVVPWRILPSGVEIVSTDFSGTGEPEFRLTLDYWEDLVLLRKLCSKFSIQTDFTEVRDFLLENKELVNLNFFRNVDFSNRKSLQLGHLTRGLRSA